MDYLLNLNRSEEAFMLASMYFALEERKTILEHTLF